MSRLNSDSTHGAVAGNRFLAQASGSLHGIVFDLQTTVIDTEGDEKRDHAVARMSIADARHIQELLERMIVFAEDALVDQPRLTLVRSAA